MHIVHNEPGSGGEAESTRAYRHFFQKMISAHKFGLLGEVTIYPLPRGTRYTQAVDTHERTLMGTIQDLFFKPVLVFGCGNTLVGDDGFGPAVIDHLTGHYRLPPHVAAFDAGTGIRELLFDLALMPQKPQLIFIVDAVSDSPNTPGEIFEVDINLIPTIKVNDFSLHQFPSVNLLRELRDDGGVKIRVLAVQAGAIPDEVRPGLSDQVRAAVPRACEWLVRAIEEV